MQSRLHQRLGITSPPYLVPRRLLAHRQQRQPGVSLPLLSTGSELNQIFTSDSQLNFAELMIND